MSFYHLFALELPRDFLYHSLNPHQAFPIVTIFTVGKSGGKKGKKISKYTADVHVIRNGEY